MYCNCTAPKNKSQEDFINQSKVSITAASSTSIFPLYQLYACVHTAHIKSHRNAMKNNQQFFKNIFHNQKIRRLEGPMVVIGKKNASL